MRFPVCTILVQDNFGGAKQISAVKRVRFVGRTGRFEKFCSPGDAQAKTKLSEMNLMRVGPKKFL